MIGLLKSVTVRSVLETLFFGKPGATANERLNYLCWGHPEPRAEHKVIVIAALAVAALAIGLIAVDADASPGASRHGDGPARPAIQIVVLPTLA